MKETNKTNVTEFILIGLTDDPKLQIFLFLLFLLCYILTIVSNIGVFALIIFASRLHTPMYFFLSNLSLSDLFYSSVIAPKMLKDLLFEKKSISFGGCVAQIFLFTLFAGIEIYMLSAMAYDRYAAICHPLLYHAIINRSVCTQLVTVVYISGVITATVSTGSTFYAAVFRINVIDHFCCEVPLLLKLSCSDRLARELAFLAVVIFFGIGSLIITVTSYIYIISTILQIPSTQGRLKTFSTCGSHLTALSLFYGPALFMYLQLPGSGSGTQSKVVSVCYTCVIPMLNPLIYCLRNKEVKASIKIITQKMWKK